MKAQFVHENFQFKRGRSSKDTIGVGFGSKNVKTKAFKVLEFIADSGEEGRSHKEIQKYIYFDLNNAPKGKDWFEEKDTGYNYKENRWDPNIKGPRSSRGYWSTQLYGWEPRYGYDNENRHRRGLLDYYCEKNEKGKWVLKRWPKSGENIFWNEDES